MMTKAGSEMELRMSGRDMKRKESERKWWISVFIVKKSVRQILRDVTLHGVSHVVSLERALWDRLVWFLGVSTFVTVFLIMFYWVQKDYYNYPYKTVVGSTPTEHLPFPAVSICNINTLDVSQVPYGDTLGDIMAWGAFTGFTLPDDSSVTEEHRRLLNTSAQTILEETNPGIDNTLKGCFYDNVKRKCDELFDVTYWAMTRCLTLNVSRLHLASATTTLRVIIFINMHGYVLQDDKSMGVKFFVHHAGDVPNFSALASTAAPGFSTHVAFQYHELKMLEFPYESYKNRYCIKPQNIRGQPENGSYFLMPCLKRKALQLAHSNCTCKAPFEADPYPGRATCTLYQMLSCVLPVLETLIRANPYDASARLGCPLPCDHRQFPSSVTFSYFPSPQAQKFLLYHRYVDNETDIRSNVLNLIFHYSDFIVHTTEYVPEYTSMSIMGTIGGNLGFFLGASVVSLGEIVELIFIAIFRILRRLSTALCGQRVQPPT